MSIIYNNQVVAGKYKEQIVNEADTLNKGIVKIATQEEVDTGTDNTTAVTPLHLSEKQDKLIAGDGIVIDENLIECTVYPDEQTIIQSDDGTIVSVGQWTKSNTIKFDWEGTEAEYEQAMKDGIIQPDWYCYITDDEVFTDYGDVVDQSLSNLKKAGIEKLNVSKMFYTGDICTEPIGYNQLLEMKHNSFDLSKYTIIGKPTITSDGTVLSESNSIALVNPPAIDTTKPFKISYSYTPNTTTQYIITSYNGVEWNKCIFSNYFIGESIEPRVCINGDSNSFTPVTLGSTLGVKYYAYLEYDGDSTFTHAIRAEGSEDWSTQTCKVTGDFLYDKFYIQAYKSSEKEGINEIYLTELSITVDGKEVFNSYKTGTDIVDGIEIPYIEARTGSKIVDAQYRDRVKQIYDINGVAGYFTLDEENQNYTLPMGELYGVLANLYDNRVSLDGDNFNEAGKENIREIVGSDWCMFDTKLSDHVLEGDDAHGWELQGTYVYREAVVGEHLGYPDFYDTCIKEYNEAIENGGIKQITLSGTVIDMYIHPNGHMYYNALTHKELVDSWFSIFGTAWYYGIDTENKRILLPRSNWFEQLTASVSDVGKSVDAGLPNITGQVQHGANSAPSGAFYGGASIGGASGGGTDAWAHFDASRCSKVYGKSSTVQPNAVKKLLYICVGNVRAKTSWINIVEQVKNGVKEIDDTRLSVLSDIDSRRESSLGEIDEAREFSLDEIEELKDLSLLEMEEKRVDSNESILSTKDNYIAEITQTATDKMNEAKYWAELAELSSSNALFDIKKSDHILNGPEERGWGLEGTCVYKEAIAGERLGYSDFYNRCLEEYKKASYYEGNVNWQGSLTNSAGVVSGFSTANYIKFPQNFNPSSGQKWEMVYKITTGSDVNTEQYICSFQKGSTNETRYATRLSIKDANLWMSVTYQGTAWDIVSEYGTYVFQPNTTYWVKLEFTGSAYITSYSLEGVTFKTDKIITSNTSMYNACTYCVLGLWNNGATLSPWLGSIDLNGSYINVDGQRWWDGVSIRRNANGHMYYPISAKAKIDGKFNSLGTAWMYGIDTENECIYLPRGNHGEIVEDYKSGTSWYRLYSDGWLEQGGICNSQQYDTVKQQVTFLKTYKDTNYTALTCAGPTTQGSWQIATRIAIKTTTGLDIRGGSNANVAYTGATTWYTQGYTETPTSQQSYTYICVGNTKADTAWINVVEQVEAGVKDIDDARIDALNNIDDLRETSLIEVGDLCETSLSEIDNLRETSLNEMENVRQTSLTEMEDKRVQSNESIISTKDQCISNVIETSEDLIEEAKSWAIGTQEERSEGSAKYWAGVAELSSSNALFDTKVSDHVLKDSEAYGWGLQGTYVYKNAVFGEHLGYPDFYNRCLEEFQNASNTKQWLKSNVTKVGSVVDNQGVLSGFSSANYATLPYYSSEIKQIDITFKFNSGATFTSEKVILGQTVANMHTPQIGITTAKEIYLLLSQDGTTWTAGIKSLPIEANTDYIVNVKWNGSKPTGTIIDANGNVSEMIQHPSYGETSNAVYWVEDCKIGTDLSTGVHDGSIDLNKSYIDVNGSRWWSGVETYTRNHNGHMFYDISQKIDVDNIFATTGMAWMYGIDQENERIFLPRNNHFEQFTSSVTDTGNYINSNVTITVPNTGWGTSGGALGTVTAGKIVVGSGAKEGSEALESLRSSGSNRTVSSSTVQPKAVKKLLYICVGNTKADTSWMKLTEQVEAGIKDIEDVRVSSLSDIENARVNSMTDIDDNRTTSMSQIDENRVNSLSDIENARVASLEDIETNRINSMGDIDNNRESSLSQIETNRINSMTDIDNNRTTSMTQINENRESSLAQIDALRNSSVKDVNIARNDSLNALANATNTLRETQITNCIKEIPQRIKYTLEDGTLTIKAGSVVIVPYGTKYDFNIIGSLNIDDNNVASGFTDTNYIQLLKPFNPQSNTWEQMWKITTGEDVVTTNNFINRTPHTTNGGFNLNIKDGKLQVYICSDGSTWDIAQGFSSELTIEPNTTYYIKCSFDGNKYLVDVSTDNIEYTNYITIESNLTVYPIVQQIGDYSGAENNNFLGSIHLNECYIKINNEIWWQGKARNISEELPIGSTFLHENFKVVDIQFEGGKFFVWAEVQSDIVSYQTVADTKMRPVLIDLSRNLISTLMNTTSSNVAFDGTGNNNNYRTDLNIIENTLSGVHNNYVMSLPLMTVMSDAVVVAKTVDQVFNGMGYIGSTIWVDKGVKGLIPWGRNTDGSLNNKIAVTTKFIMVSTGANQKNATVRLGENSLQTGVLEHDLLTNYNYLGGAEYTQANIRGYVMAGVFSSDSNGIVTDFQIKQSFRAVDFGDFDIIRNEVQSSLQPLTKAYITETYVNGTSWYRIWSDGWIEQGLRTSNSATFLKPFKNANYCLVRSGPLGGSDIDWVDRVNSITAKGFTLAESKGTSIFYACGY